MSWLSQLLYPSQQPETLRVKLRVKKLQCSVRRSSVCAVNLSCGFVTGSLRKTILSYCCCAFRESQEHFGGAEERISRKNWHLWWLCWFGQRHFQYSPAHMQKQEWCFDLLSVVSTVLSSWQAVVKQLLCPVGTAVGHRDIQRQQFCFDCRREKIMSEGKIWILIT